MNEAVLQKLLQLWADQDDWPIGPCEPRLADKVDALPIPSAIKHLLKNCWPECEATIGGVGIRTTGQVLAPLDLKNFLPADTLAVGDVGNGDWTALRWNDDRCDIGFISHDELWEDGKVSFAPIAESFEAFLQLAIEGHEFPMDYFDAVH